MAEKMHNVTVLLTPEQWQEVKAEADEVGLRVSHFMRMVVLNEIRADDE